MGEESRRTWGLLGHLQIFDFEDFSMLQMRKAAVKEKAKAILSAMNYYVEMGYKVYVINASGLFGTVWSVVQTFLSPRASAKVAVNTAKMGLPAELLAALG